MRVTKKPLYLLAFSVLMYFFASPAALAMKCYLGTDVNNTLDKDTLSVIAYLGNKGNGERIWTSKVFSRTVTCVAEFMVGSVKENVFLYPYPKRATQNLPAGVKLGLIFDGKDLGVFDTNSSSELSKIDTGWTVNGVASSKTMTFQTYLVKEGTISTIGVGDVTLFQLDGEGGLNATEGANYNITLSGWNNIGSVTCNDSHNKNPLHLPGFKISDILKKEAKQSTSSYINMEITCTSSSSNLIPHIKSLTSEVTFNSAAFAKNSNYFATNMPELGLMVKAEKKDVGPQSKININIPMLSGVARHNLDLEIAPFISSLDLNNPGWLFSAESPTITASFPYSFTVSEIQTE